MAATSRSTDRTRSQRAVRMIQQAVRVAGQGSEMRRLRRQMLVLVKALVRLANEPIDQTVNSPTLLNLLNHFQRLSRMTHLEVMVPLQRLMVPRLPQGPASVGSGHNPFPDEMVRIAGFEEMTVMSSLQRPKKVTMLGNDGNRYPFLIKSGDLQSDAQVMDIFSMVNSLLSRDDEADERGMSKSYYFP
jgi:serine/threonine-protein kinase ATR